MSTKTICPKLTLSGKEIHDITELRENFNMEEILLHIKNKELAKWLKCHYYELEALVIENVDITTPDCKNIIYEALGVSPQFSLSKEESSVKQEILKQYTSDPEILKNVALVAFTQEELAKMINTNQPIIYLCHNTFSIPIRKPDIKYIGIGNPQIETVFTKEQYEKAGIILENISVADKPNSKYEDFASKAASDYGYDDFIETHTLFTTTLHNQLSFQQNNLLSSQALELYYHIPITGICDYKEFDSKSECQAALKKRLQAAYDNANSYFNINSSKCLSKTVAEFYGNYIEETLTPVMNALGDLAKLCNNQNIYQELNKLVKDAIKYFESTFKEEISDNLSYYSMYDFKYFLERVDLVEEDPIYVSDENDTFFLLVEKILAPARKWHYEGSLDSIMEIEKDLNTSAASFHKTAHKMYKTYVDKIEMLVEEIVQELPAMTNNESMIDYLNRILIKEVAK